jgi:hypothetical protein
MHPTSRKLYNSQSDIWDAHEPVEGEFTLLPVGVPPLITTSQEILLANAPFGGGEGYGSPTLFYPNPWNRTPADAYPVFGTLQSGEDFFPFYQNGRFWSIRRVKSMLMNGTLIDSEDPDHAACFVMPSEATDGFYQISLGNATPFNLFNAITDLTAGQTLALTEITMFVTVT